MNRPIEVLQVIEQGQTFDLDQTVKPALHAPVANQNGLSHHRRVNDEALRLVHQVFLSHSEQPPSVVVFAGMDHGNGCSEICASVAETLARDPLRSVCLVEANFRSPAAAGLFGVPGSSGLTDALTRMGPIRSFMRPLEYPVNLWLLSCGTLHPDSPGLLASRALPERIAELRQEFDFVIIDTPPVTRYADAIALGQLADGLVLVVVAGITRRDETTAAVASLRASKISILAAVLNKGASPVP